MEIKLSKSDRMPKRPFKGNFKNSSYVSKEDSVSKVEKPSCHWKSTPTRKQALKRIYNNKVRFYRNFRDLSRMFRKWRFFVSNHELKAVEKFVFNLKLKNIISNRINYEKRKSKALTILAFRLQKIKLRNYFIKYWANVKEKTINIER